MPYVVGSLPNLHNKHEIGICHKPTLEENREQILTGARAACIYHKPPLQSTVYASTSALATSPTTVFELRYRIAPCSARLAPAVSVKP